MKLVTVKMPEIYVKAIEELVAAGRYSSRSEVIRIAVRELLKRELWGTGSLGFPVPVGQPALDEPDSGLTHLSRIAHGIDVEA